MKLKKIKNRIYIFIRHVLPSVIQILNLLLLISSIIIFLLNITNIAVIHVITIFASLAALTLVYYLVKGRSFNKEITKKIMKFSFDFKRENNYIDILINAYLLFQGSCIFFSAFGLSLMLTSPLSIIILSAVMIPYILTKSNDCNTDKKDEIENLSSIFWPNFYIAVLVSLAISPAVFFVMYYVCKFLFLSSTLSFLYPGFIFLVPAVLVAELIGITYLTYSLNTRNNYTTIKILDFNIQNIRSLINTIILSLLVFTILSSLHFIPFTIISLSLVIISFLGVGYLIRALSQYNYSQVKNDIRMSWVTMRNIVMSSLACLTVLTQLNLVTFTVSGLAVIPAVVVALKFLPIIIALAIIISASVRFYDNHSRETSTLRLIQYQNELTAEELKSSDKHNHNYKMVENELGTSPINTPREKK